jgi:hypothetical protein
VQGEPFHLSVIVMELIANDLQGFNWYISEKTDNANANENI